MASNTFITPTVIAREVILALRNNLVMGKLVNRQYEKEYKAVGQSVLVRKPVKFRVTKAAARTNSDITESTETFTVATQAHVSWEVTSAERTMEVPEYISRYLEPAGAAIANQIDTDLLGLYDDVYNEVGTPGNTPSTFAELAAAARRLDDEACPQQDRYAVFNPDGNWSMADALKGTFDPTLANQTIRQGRLGRIANMEVFMSQNIKSHTVGTHSTGSTPLVNGASQSGASLVTNGWANSTAVLKAGDVFTIANVYAVNPESGVSTAVLRQFVALSDVTSDGSGNGTISISPSITATGAYQTVSAAPANDAAITVVGTEATVYPKNLVFNKNAFGLVVIPMSMPKSAYGTVVRDSRTGLSIRVVVDFDIDNDKEIIRLDSYYGIKTLDAALACRITG
jgi:hypothetical protein